MALVTKSRNKRISSRGKMRDEATRSSHMRHAGLARLGPRIRFVGALDSKVRNDVADIALVMSLPRIDDEYTTRTF